MPIMSPEDRLRSMTSADSDPTLSENEIHMLLETSSIASVYPTWAPDTAYSVGARVVPSPRTGLVYAATVAGTSGSSLPPFTNEHNDPVSDGSVTWELADTEVAFNLNRAAAEGWRIKAGKVANRFDMKTEVNQTFRSQMYKHCMDMHKSYKVAAAGGVGSIIFVSDQGTYNYDPVIANLNPAP